jgi:hypothetical protein
MIDRLLSRIRNAEDRRWLGILISLAILALAQGVIYAALSQLAVR